MKNKNKTFVVVREVLAQVWVKESFTIEARNKAEAINIVRIVPEDDLHNLYSFESERIPETEKIISSQIKVEECYEIPTQLKLEI
jgi:hypothetical protein